jgi:hypothetical protein
LEKLRQELADIAVLRAGTMRHPTVAVRDRPARAIRERAADDDRRIWRLHRFRPGEHRPEIDQSAVYSGVSWVRMAFIASTRSRTSFHRPLKSMVPWSAISSAFQPPPMPNRNLPWET